MHSDKACFHTIQNDATQDCIADVKTNPLPQLWQDILFQAQSRPGEVFTPDADGPYGSEEEQTAEKMADAGLLRVVRARQYQISALGKRHLRYAVQRRAVLQVPSYVSSGWPRIAVGLASLAFVVAVAIFAYR